MIKLAQCSLFDFQDVIWRAEGHACLYINAWIHPFFTWTEDFVNMMRLNEVSLQPMKSSHSLHERPPQSHFTVHFNFLFHNNFLCLKKPFKLDKYGESYMSKLTFSPSNMVSFLINYKKRQSFIIMNKHSRFTSPCVNCCSMQKNTFSQKNLVSY